ncbi:MAG TPA: efflux RND transporter periplasmic adaptor subunit [Steroidobacteraceae bacterium]|jgi:RND family efflux transporter MFP subunit|nr:efflux RND transporter periplasmic adaptor subunit [Steroidobacteraceae bacterium]
MTEPETSPLQRRLRRTLLFGAIGVCVIILLGIGLRLRAQAQVKRWTETQAIPTVDIVSPQAAAQMQELVLPGTLNAFIDAPIYARVDGYLKDWYVDIGAHVHAGQPLADIETPELDQQIHQVEADLATAKAHDDLDRITAERWKKMLAAQSVSQQEADEKAAAYSVSQSNVNAAQANLERLKALAAFKHVVAPFDGIVTARNTDKGDLINAGAGGKGNELFRVADEHEARVYVDVPQTDAGKIKVGLAAQLELPENPGVKVPAKVADISEAVSVASRTMQVELLADNPDHLLLPGDYVEVHFQIPAPLHVLELPTTALIFRKEGLQVATVDGGNHIVLKPIQIAQERGAVVNVKLGVTPQDRVVDSPPDSIINGELVRIAQR